MRRGWWLLLASVGLGCQANSPVYVPPMAPLEAGQGMAASATSTVELAFRQPTEDERMQLREEGQRLKQTLPWLKVDDVALSLLYTITNLSDRQGTARLEVNGASEFASYDPGPLRAAAAMAGDDDVTYFSLIQPTPVAVAPGQRISGIVREDDFREAALDLDAIGRWMAEPTSVLINRSEVNPVGLAMVPQGLVVPALFRVQVLFSASQHMRLEFLVRVRDQRGQLLEPGAEGVFAPRPRAYMPPAAPPP